MDENTRLMGWISKSVPEWRVQTIQAERLRNNKGREVWSCEVSGTGVKTPVILSLFKPCPPERTNTSLSSLAAARKCALAFQEMHKLGVPTPKIFGAAAEGQIASVVTEKVEQLPWDTRTRVEAARYLARLHLGKTELLSEEFKDLILQSDARQSRTWF